MSEARKECYKCSNNSKCIPQANYDSIYCQTHRKFKMPIIKEKYNANTKEDNKR